MAVVSRRRRLQTSWSGLRAATGACTVSPESGCWSMMPDLLGGLHLDAGVGGVVGTHARRSRPSFVRAGVVSRSGAAARSARVYSSRGER